MPRKSVAQSRCALCGAKDVSEPRGEEKYCRDCWDKKIAVEEIVAREFALKRYIRAHSAEKYLVYHSTLKRPCGQIIVIDDGYDLFLSLVLYPSFGWDEAAYHLEGDPEGRRVHAASGEDHVHMFEVWDSREQFDAHSQRLFGLLADAGLDPGIVEVHPLHSAPPD